MPRVQSQNDLICRNCGACIAPAGLITCLRCKQPIPIASAEMSGSWPCPKCLEHGKKPRTLAIDGAIQCRFCVYKTTIPIVNEENDMTTESMPTKTTLFRDHILLALKNVARKKMITLGDLEKLDSEGLKRFEQDLSCLEQQERDLMNMLEALDSGFDPQRIDDILDQDKGDRISIIDLRYTTFQYFLYIGLSGLNYVSFSIDPAKKTFGVLVRDNDEHARVSYQAMQLEKISYLTVSRDNWLKNPEIVIRGKFHGVPVKLSLSKAHISLRGGFDDLDNKFTSDPAWLSLPLREKKLTSRRT